MKVFVTGGTGYIGNAVSLQLKKAGHDVQALVRNKDKASALQAAGVKLVQGDLGNPAGYAAAAYGVQAIVHCASDSGPQHVELDRKSIQNARELLHGRVGATFIYTSGVWVYGSAPPGRILPSTSECLVPGHGHARTGRQPARRDLAAGRQPAAATGAGGHAGELAETREIEP